MEELSSISKSSSSTESLNSNSSVLLDSGGVVAQQHGGGGGGEAVQAEHRQVLVVDLLLLRLLGQDPLRGLDTRKDPGLALIGPVGSNTKTDLLRMSVRLVISGQLEHFNWRSWINITEPASAKD